MAKSLCIWGLYSATNCNLLLLRFIQIVSHYRLPRQGYTYLLHGAESFLRSHPVFRYSRNSPHFVEPEGSLPHSQVPATCPYPEPARSSPFPPHPTSWRSVLILSSHLRLGLPSDLIPSGFLTKTLYTPLPSPYALHAPPISFYMQCNNTRNISSYLTVNTHTLTPSITKINILMLIEDMLALYCEIYAQRKYNVSADCRVFQCSSGW